MHVMDESVTMTRGELRAMIDDAVARAIAAHTPTPCAQQTPLVVNVRMTSLAQPQPAAPPRPPGVTPPRPLPVPPRVPTVLQPITVNVAQDDVPKLQKYKGE